MSKNAVNKLQLYFYNLKYSRKLKKAESYIDNNVDKESGFSVPYEDINEQYNEKDIKPDIYSLTSFEAAFNKDIWYNMSVEQQILSLIWLEDYFANKHNRPSATFNLNGQAKNYDAFTNEEGDVVYVLPFRKILEGDELPFDYARHIIELGAYANAVNKGKDFVKKDDYLQGLVYLGAKFTEEQRKQYLSYLKQDEVKQIKEDLKELALSGERNDCYISEDGFYRGYIEDLEYEEDKENKFIENDKASLEI